jgi:hypothetical protein
MLGETNFTIANNQSTFADITGLTFESDQAQAVEVDYYIKRTDDAPTYLFQMGRFRLHFRSDTNLWVFTDGRIDGDDALNVGVEPLKVVTSGSGPYTAQVQYKSSNLTGGSQSQFMRFKARSFTP